MAFEGFAHNDSVARKLTIPVHHIAARREEQGQHSAVDVGTVRSVKLATARTASGGR
jgi:hypothetical protein